MKVAAIMLSYSGLDRECITKVCNYR